MLPAASWIAAVENHAWAAVAAKKRDDWWQRSSLKASAQGDGGQGGFAEDVKQHQPDDLRGRGPDVEP